MEYKKAELATQYNANVFASSLSGVDEENIPRDNIPKVF